MAKTKAKMETKPPAPAPKPAVKPEPEQKADMRIITVLAKENPKRPGTACYNRFNLYKNGMKVSDYLAAGGQRGDIPWDAKRKFIALKG
jgi:hypothetical protein